MPARPFDRLGLQPVTLDDLPAPIDEDDVAVVCWMTVLPTAQGGMAPVGSREQDPVPTGVHS